MASGVSVTATPFTSHNPFAVFGKSSSSRSFACSSFAMAFNCAMICGRKTDRFAPAFFWQNAGNPFAPSSNCRCPSKTTGTARPPRMAWATLGSIFSSNS